MKNLTTLFFAFITLTASNAFATDIKDIEMFGYARAGVGTNIRGGDQECFYNQGAGGGSGIGRNEFRLGNECSNYLEVGLKFNHIKSDTKKAFTQFRVSNSHNGHEQTESASQSTNFVEAFAQIEGMNDLPWSFWVGKKFYRDHDVYIDDYYYFGSMNGNGAGVGNIDVGNSKLSLAYLRQVGATKTNRGTEGLTILDARFKEIKLTDTIKQNVWLAYGQSPESTNLTTGDKYVKSTGFVVGTLIEFNLWDNGFNHTALMFGQGVMNEFNLYGDSTVTGFNTHKDKQRYRFINHTTYNLSTKWAYHLAASIESQQIKGETGSQWYSLGVRPLYRVTDTFHLTAEVGHSVVNDSKDRQLTRVTFAPQLSVSENIWGRPVLRAFYTHSFWNTANRSQVAGQAPTFASTNSGGAYGFQMESFF
jgi:maltoporin